MIYIAGKMRGLPDLGWSKFKEAEDMLATQGHEYYSPRKADEVEGITAEWLYAKPQEEQDYICQSLFTKSLSALVKCDAILLLDNWLESRGARLEADLAVATGMSVYVMSRHGDNATIVETPGKSINAALDKFPPHQRRSMKPIAEEAADLIGGDRNDSYGCFKEEAKHVAKVWSGITHHDISPRHVALMMTGLKLVRQSNKNKRDNLVDGVGYLLLQEEVEDAES